MMAGRANVLIDWHVTALGMCRSAKKKRQSFFSCFTSVSKEEFSVVILKKGDKIHNKKNETNGVFRFFFFFH